MCHAKFFTPGLFGIIHINTNNHTSPNHAQPLNDIQANTAKSKDYANAARLSLGRIDHRANPSCNPASDITNLIERCGLINFGKCNFRQDCEVGKGRGSHIMQNRLSFYRKPASAIRHNTLTLSGANSLTQICFGMQTIITFATFRRIKRDYMITHPNTCNTRTYLADDTSPFMPQNSRKQAFRISPGKGEFICMTNASRHDFNKHLAIAWAIKIYFHNF